uniref:C-type lectin domain-containing protein n=1 Tax=Strigamia maritima TaxID=126957 RepID=T1IM83_STRMM
MQEAVANGTFIEFHWPWLGWPWGNPCEMQTEKPDTPASTKQPSGTPVISEKPSDAPVAPVASEKPSDAPVTPEKPSDAPVAPVASEKPSDTTTVPSKPSKENSEIANRMSSNPCRENFQKMEISGKTSCVYFSPELMTYNDAIEKCDTMKSSLVTIDNEKRSKLLQKSIKLLYGDNIRESWVNNRTCEYISHCLEDNEPSSCCMFVDWRPVLHCWSYINCDAKKPTTCTVDPSLEIDPTDWPSYVSQDK